MSPGEPLVVDASTSNVKASTDVEVHSALGYSTDDTTTTGAVEKVFTSSPHLPVVCRLTPVSFNLLHLIAEQIYRLARVLAARLELPRLFAVIYSAREGQLHFRFVCVTQRA
jgi:hypothetical protein